MIGIPGLGDTRSTHLTTFTIVADGAALDRDIDIVSIEIRRQVNRVPRATIVLLDGNAAAQTFAVSEQPTFVPGVAIEIRGGYASDEATLFSGIVTRHRIEVGRAGGTRLIVELRDAVYAMAQGRRSRNFADVSDADVFEQLISGHAGLRPQVTATTIVHPQVVQHQVSDWDFLISRAETCGCDVNVVDGTVQVAPPPSAGAAVATALFGQGVFSAELELDATAQLASTETGSWDPANQELATADSDDVAVAIPGDTGGGDIAGDAQAALRHAGVRDRAELDAWAAAETGRGRRAAVRGRVVIQGTGSVLPGTLVELGGFGSRFNGLGLVSAIRHRLGRGDWRTDVVVGSDPRRHAEKFAIAAPPAAGLIPPIDGLQIGIVVALESDPAGEDRIQLRIPTITDTDGLLWARQAVVDGGDSRGVVFRPEIDDEVIVGFVDNDPRDPVILGALHSSAHPSPIPGADDNHEKGIVTRSGIRLHFDDDLAVLTLETPAGNRIQLSDDEGSIVIGDENGHTVTLSSDGIALESAGDIALTASGDVKIEGANVELKAGASVKAEGSAGAELTSSATTVVKGSLVQIN